MYARPDPYLMSEMLQPSYEWTSIVIHEHPRDGTGKHGRQFPTFNYQAPRPRLPLFIDLPELLHELGHYCRGNGSTKRVSAQETAW